MGYPTPNSIPTERICRTIQIPDDPLWLAIVNGALSELLDIRNYEAYGTLTPEETANQFALMFGDYLDSSCEETTPGEVTLNLQVADDTNNDACRYGGYRNGEQLLFVGVDPSNVDCGGGVRFTNVTIPQGATIVSATLDFWNEYDEYGDHVKGLIYGEAADDAVIFSSGNPPVSRPLTTASAAWDSSGTIASEAWISTTSNAPPDISAIVQEIVNRSGWAAGNALAIIGRDNGCGSDWNWNFADFDRDPTLAAKLTVVYHE